MGRGKSPLGGSLNERQVVTLESASEDWFEYEKANLMSQYIRTGKMPDEYIDGTKVSDKEKKMLMAEAELMQAEASKTNTGQKTLYRGMVMSEPDARALSPGQTYTTRTLTATTPDKRMSTTYADVENYGGGSGVSVIMTFQKPDGMRGVKRDSMETVMPKGAKFKIVRNYMDKDGVVHIDLYAKKGKNT